MQFMVKPMKPVQRLFLNEEQVRQHLRMSDLIPAMEKALVDFSAGKVTQPLRSVIKVEPPSGFLGLMPALTPDDVLSIQCRTRHPHAYGHHFSC
jgi:ornithine cyclodeaminase/alanine dehydrogenase-like protein (mu-crystallin family)